MSKIRCARIIALLAFLFSGAAANASVVLTTLASFGGANGANPDAGLMQAADGLLYGTTTGGGSGNLGTVFRISPDGSDLISLVSFSESDGAYPKSVLVQNLGGDFSLFGTTSAGGTSNLGTVFKISTNGELASLVSFQGTNGAIPQAGLASGGDGHFYGATYYGGTNDWPNGYGVVYRLTTGGEMTPLASFANTNGAEPYGPLCRASGGNFYGTTQLGGAGGLGSIFKVGSAGVISTVTSFFSTNGALPLAGLVQGTDGNLYGTTLAGGANDLGTVFKVSTSGSFTTLVSFSGSNGASPSAGLIEGNDGNFYGTTAQGGANDFGTVFQITPSGTLTTLVTFNSTNGANPYAGLLLVDGSLYGTTGNGGSDDLGTIYRVSFTAPPSLPIVQTISLSGETVALNWNATVGQEYGVQYKTNLSDTAWNDLTNLVATNTTMTLFLQIGAEPQRFYRVGWMP